MRKQKGFVGTEEGIPFHVLAEKKPSKKTEAAIREMVKKAFHFIKNKD